MKAPGLDTVRNRLALLFFAITAGAIGFVYLYVVPQLRDSLTVERLAALEEVMHSERGRIARAIEGPRSASELQRLVAEVSRLADARATLLAMEGGPAGPRPAAVIADSEPGGGAPIPDFPAATAAAAGERVGYAVEGVEGQRVGEAAIAGFRGGEPRWAAVLSVSLGGVEDNVALIRRQILIAGGIALLAALAAGYLAARAHARRLSRLERAAEKVADGDFSAPIPVDSSDEVGQLAATFDEMQRRLARLDSARKEFIANASHELRTPIFSLGGFVELLESDEPDPDERRRFVGEMRGQVERLEKLATDLLDLSKLDAGALEIAVQPLELARLAGSVLAEFEPAARAHRSTLTRRGGTEVWAGADPARVRQIIRILVDNALSHTPEGTSIEVGIESRDGQARVAVSDDGPGIDPTTAMRLFERFYAGDSARGSGLGLAIARELARRMDGELRLAGPGPGTELVLALPLAAGPEVEA